MPATSDTRSETPTAGRVFAVMPAAGLSRRMGQPKLLLPWGEQTILGHIIQVLCETACADVVVVVRPGDEAVGDVVKNSSATLVVPPEAPPDMRSSVQFGLRHIRDHWQPTERDAWLLAPADQPTVRREWIDAIIAQWARLPTESQPQAIVVPVHQGRRGHPVLLAWPYAAAVERLPSDVGVNHLLRQHAEHVHEVPISDSEVLADLDTPEEYRKLRD